MPERARIPGAIGALLLLSGCAGLTASPRSPIPKIERAIEGDPARGIDGLQASYTPVKVTECLARSLEREEAEARDCRDRIVQALVTAINLRYAEFEVGFFDANRYSNFGATAAVLGLGAAGTVSGAGATQALSAAITAITGTRAAFNREVMLEQTAAALLTAMRAQRNVAELRLRKGLRLPAKEYPLGFALSDVYALFRAGTVPGALAGVTQAVGVQEDVAQQDLQQELRRAVPVAQAGAARCLQGLIGDEKLTREARAENRRRMRAEMDALGIPATVRPDAFAFDADPARAAQQRTVAERLDCRV